MGRGRVRRSRGTLQSFTRCSSESLPLKRSFAVLSGAGRCGGRAGSAAKPGASATEAELIAFCREGLAGFKAPKQVVFTELPRTSTGKIQKHVLRAQVRPG